MFEVIIRYNSKDYPTFTLTTGETADVALTKFYYTLGFGNFHKCSVILYDVKNHLETVIFNYWNVD